MYCVLVFVFFCCSTLIGKEWILTNPGNSVEWSRIVKGRVQLARVFGPDQQYALINGTSKNVRKMLTQDLANLRVQPNYEYRALVDPEFYKSWGLENTKAEHLGKDIGAVEAWRIHTGDPSQMVAIVDSGINVNHPELKANIWRNIGERKDGKDNDGNGFIDDIFGWNFVDGNSDVRDESGHGTFCAGIIGASANNGEGSRGVVWQVQMLPLKSLNEHGLGSTVNAALAIEYAVKKGAKIINASWGGKKYDPILYEMIQWAGERGVLVIAASGNSGTNNDVDEPIYPASFKLPNIIAVAAYDDEDRIWKHSNFGNKSVHIGAPGVRVFSTRGEGYEYGNGSSFAAAHVSGVAALLWSYVPGLSLAAIRNRLIETSQVIHYYEKERISSAGRVHAYQALVDIRPSRPQIPVQWHRIVTEKQTSHPYQNNQTLRFEFSYPGATHVRVRFRSFDTEKKYDEVFLEDGQGEVFARYSGSLGDFWSADALGQDLNVIFRTDSVTADFGFLIDAIEVNYERLGSGVWEAMSLFASQSLGSFLIPWLFEPIGSEQLFPNLRKAQTSFWPRLSISEGVWSEGLQTAQKRQE